MFIIINMILLVLESIVYYKVAHSYAYTFSHFLVMHFLIYVVFSLNLNFFKKESFPFHNIILFLPFYGMFIYMIYLIFPKKNINFEVVDEVFDYERYIGEREHLEKIDDEKELSIISKVDEITYNDPEQNKKLVMDVLNYEEIPLKVKLLRKALNVQDDQEVLHYAAVTLNEILKDFEERQNQLEKEYKKEKSEENLEKLVDFYEKYLESRILEEFMYNLYFKRYFSYLETLLELKAKNKNSEEYKKYFKHYYTKIYQHYYETDDYDKIKELEKEIEKKGFTIKEILSEDSL